MFKSKNEWFEKYNFNTDGITYIYFPADSYDVKEELKDAGFRFSKELLWHIDQVPEGYEDKVITVDFNEIGEMSAWNEGFFRPEVRKIINDKLTQVRPAAAPSESDWIGVEKERFYDLPATLVSVRMVNTRYGETQLVKFLADKSEILWWTKSMVKANVGDNVLLTATVKEHGEYAGTKQTTVTRAIIKAV